MVRIKIDRIQEELNELQGEPDFVIKKGFCRFCKMKLTGWHRENPCEESVAHPK